ncbi:MAG: hypothetical protein ABIA93_03390 [Candidatus Woesearchaeota archaeon]
MAMKAQSWSIDFMIAMLIFIIAAVLSIKFLVNTGSNSGFDDVQREANGVASTLLSAGFPEDWTNDTVVRPGLLEDDRLSPSKFGELLNIQYSTLRGILNVQHDFFFYFMNATNPNEPFFMNASCGYGSSDVNVTVESSGGASTTCTGQNCTGSIEKCQGTYSDCTGGGATCAGTYGACLGTPVECWEVEDLGKLCTAQRWCYTNEVTGLCDGSPLPCSSFGSKTCKNQLGCAWYTCNNYTSNPSTCVAAPHNITCSWVTCSSYNTSVSQCTALTGCTFNNCTTDNPTGAGDCNPQFGGGKCEWHTCDDYVANPAACTALGCTSPTCSGFSDSPSCTLAGCTWTVIPGAGPVQGNCTVDTSGISGNQIARVDRLVLAPNAAGDVEQLVRMTLYVWD